MIKIEPAGSLWEATAEPAPAMTPLEGETTADVCVVGAGFTGLSAALHLAEAGADVVVVDQGGPGFGGSGRNGGQILPGLKWDPDEVEAMLGPEAGGHLVAFAGGAPDLVYGLVEKHGIECHLRKRCGWIHGAMTEAALKAQAKRVEQWQRRGAPVELLDRQRAAALTGTSRYAGAMLDRRAGAINPLSYARGLAAAAQRHGARVHNETAARKLAREGNRWRVETGGGAVVADQVLLCTNAYTDDLWPGLRRELIPLHSLQVATPPLPEDVRRTILPEGHVVSDTQRILFYFRLNEEGRFVMGGRGSFGETNRPALFRFIEGAAERLFPQLGKPRWEFRWAGKVALTVDHLPRVHELAPGVRTVGGYNGRGVAMASASGKALAEWTRTGDSKPLPLPITPLKPIPLHGLRRPVLELITGYYRLLDRFA